MIRKILSVLFLMLVMGSASLLPPSVDAQSSGCSSVGALTGWVGEWEIVSTGSQPFVSGETVTVSGGDGFDFMVSGTASFSSNGTSASYTIPQDGNYTITVAKNSDGDVNITASCSGGSGGGGGTGTYNTWAFSIYDRGNNVYHVWGDCNGDECQLVAIVDLSQAVVSPTQFKDYDGTWFVDVHQISNDGQHIVFQFNVYSGSILYDDGFRVRLPVSTNQTTPPNDDPDGDGFIGGDDACPQVAGTMFGCPDSDGDGIFDLADNCPDIPAPDGIRGCPATDTDGDTVIDDEDECPDTAGLVILNGCPPQQSVTTTPVISVEVLVPEEQCFYVHIAALAPIDRWPEPDGGRQTAGGEFTIRSKNGTVVTMETWSAQIGFEGEMSYTENISVPTGLPLGSDLEVIFLEDTVEGEEPFTLTSSGMQIKDSDCSAVLPDGPVTLFQYAATNGSFSDFVVDGVEIDCGPQFTTVYGVPVVLPPHSCLE